MIRRKASGKGNRINIWAAQIEDILIHPCLQIVNSRMIEGLKMSHHRAGSHSRINCLLGWCLYSGCWFEVCLLNFNEIFTAEIFFRNQFFPDLMRWFQAWQWSAGPNANCLDCVLLCASLNISEWVGLHDNFTPTGVIACSVFVVFFFLFNYSGK